MESELSLACTRKDASGSARSTHHDGLVPWMLVEIAADELLIFRLLVKRAGRRVHAQKTAARANKSVNASKAHFGRKKVA
jgi:hypothetical protein